ncbi:hypothetical protein V490_03375 [Pseudogymnoascus sp. VKM F-3557]|nr:hypothetical protein V490_03375 [Pseudogymnoascus sp. VKM F-3557]
MASNVASSDPPMALGRRQELQLLRIPFRILPHEFLFTPRLGDIMSKQQLRNYVDGLLKDLARQYPTTVSPQPGVWKLVRDNADVDLDKWDPCSLEVDKTFYITSNIKTSNIKTSSAIVASTTATGNTSWTWGNEMIPSLPNEAQDIKEEMENRGNKPCRVHSNVIHSARLAEANTDQPCLWRLCRVSRG